MDEKYHKRRNSGRIGFSIPAELKTRLDAFADQVCWSRVAADLLAKFVTDLEREAQKKGAVKS